MTGSHIFSKWYSYCKIINFLPMSFFSLDTTPESSILMQKKNYPVIFTEEENRHLQILPIMESQILPR